MRGTLYSAPTCILDFKDRWVAFILFVITRSTVYRRAIVRVGIEALTRELISQHDWIFPVVNRA